MAPSPPPIGASYDAEARVLVVGSAPRYHLRVSTIESCRQIDLDRDNPAATDPRAIVIETSQAPLDMSRFDRCDTCYYYAVYGVLGETRRSGGCTYSGWTVGSGGGFIPSPCR